MGENEEDYQKNPKSNSLNEKDAKVSIIYVRKKNPQIVKKLSYGHNLYDKERIKLFKLNHLQIFKCKNGLLNCFINKDQESCLSHNKVLSMPELNYLENEYKSSFNRQSCNYFFSQNRPFFKSNFLVYILPKMHYQNPECPFLKNSVLKIYRCQLNTHEESCCCSCNSDAMFEVMKSLYDCYKKKNCDNCNCILCGHLPREERRLGELRKSGVSVPLAKIEEKKRKKSKEKVKRKISSLQGKNLEEKEQILKDHIKSGAPLPQPKTKSDKELIKKAQTELGRPPEVLERTLLDIKKIPSDKLKKLKEDGLLTPLEGKSSQQKEKILTGLAMNGIPLPKGKSASEKKIIDKVRKDVGLPPEPQTSSDKKRYDKAMSKGLITPLLGKSASEKERILKGQADLGLTLPEGRTPSEKKLISKMKVTKAEPSDLKVPLAKLQKSKAEGLLTPLQGKTPEEKEKIVRDLAMKGVPLPEGKSASEKKLINKIRTEVGLPPQPKTPSTKEKYAKAQAAGLIVPLEGKTEPQKEKILKEQAKIGLSLPEGRTSSEKALIAKVKAQTQEPLEIAVPSDGIKSAKAAGLITPLQGKTPEQKETILKGLAMHNIPLPEAKTASEMLAIDKVRKDLGLPPEPKSKKEKGKYNQAVAAGFITPLEGKTQAEKERILQGQADLGLQLPEGRTPSEKALIAKVKARTQPLAEISIPSDKIKSDKAAGLLTPLHGKTPEQKVKILRDLAMQNIPLPEAKTASEKLAIDKVRKDIGLPPEPKSKKEKSKYNQAVAAGLIIPLEGKSQAEKERLLQGQAELGLQLPEGRSPSEKALIKKIKSKKKKHRDKSVEGILPPDKRKKLDDKTRKVLKEGKGPSDECICSLISPESDRVIESKSKATKTKDIKTPSQKEKILRELAKQGSPLPEPKTASEKKILDKVNAELGLPPVPTTPSLKEKYAKAQKAGVITPLQGKTSSQKEIILRKQAEMGIPLPEGRTPSEKALVNKIRATVKPESIASEKLRKAKEAGLLTPLTGKSPEEQKRILRNIAKAGLPLPEGKTPSEKQIIQKVKDDMGLPSKRIPSEIFRKAKAAGLITPLVDKTPAQKEKILRDRLAVGLPLPEGVTPSEKQLIKKIKTSPGYSSPKISSAKLKKAKTAELLKSLEGKTPSQKEKILEQQIAAGLPLPEGKTRSDKEIIKKIQAKRLEGKTASQKEKILRSIAKQGLALPEPKTISEKALIDKVLVKEKASKEIKPLSAKLRLAKNAGLLTPLEGKSPEQKEKILKGLAKAGIPLPEGKTSSEKKIIEKVREDIGLPPEPKTSSMKNKMKQAQLAGIITPLEGKTPTEKEKILKKMQENDIPLPKGRTASEKSLIKKIKADVKSKPHEVPSSKIEKAKVEGILTPLEGKTPAQKEKIIRELVQSGRPLPEGKTRSEKALIKKIKAEKGRVLSPEKIKKLDKNTAKRMKEGKGPSDECICHILSPKIEKERSAGALKIPSEKLRKAKEAGLLTPLQGKSLTEKEKILKGLAMQGIPLPEAKTTSEKKLINKVRADVGLPPEPRTPSLKEKYNKAMDAGLITPLQGKSNGQKEKILKGQAQMGLPLPEGRTPSEKDLIAKVKATTPPLSKVHVPPKKSVKTKVSLEGKTPEEKEKILKNLAMQGIPLPEAKTTSEKKLINKIRADVGLPPEPKTSSLKEKYNKAIAAGFITPLQGKSSAQKEKILRGQAQMGVPLPEGRTPSEKDLIARIKQTVPPPSEALKHDKSKVAGLLTPLEGKPLEKKEKILRSLAEAGLPLPEGKTPSEKILIQKVKTEYEKPSKGRVETFSEKKDKIKTKSKKIGVAAERLSGKRVTKTKGAITEEFQDIIKSTTCDRGCGCDKKKIRFKHSYVKIRVTSPDISSLCPCPEECVPGVKGGIFTDNEGIKVTVGRVTGTPSFSSKSFYSDVNFKLYKTYFEPSYAILSTTSCISGEKSTSTLSRYHYIYGNHYNGNKSKSETKVNRQSSYINDVSQNIIHSFDCIDIGSLISKNRATFGNSQPFKENTRKSISSQNCSITDTLNNTSFESIYLLNRNSSVSLITLPDSISVISFSTTDSSSSSSFYELKQNLNDCEIMTNSLFELQNSNISLSTVESVRNNNKKEYFTCSSNRNFISFRNGYDICMFGIHKTNVRNSMKLKPSKYNKSNITVNKISNNLDIQQLLCRILPREQLYDTSSLIVVMSTSSDENYPRYGQISSTIALDLIEKNCSWNYKVHSLRRNRNDRHWLLISEKPKLTIGFVEALLADNREHV
ncbi:unnamed protein product [Euphydryas editha]|uniref:Uncharacterized protein n=1 Tax=Euphydryas editha TaxID=104508 RepID=A0AAU9UXF1_EUPED|nr:unnamed protein product [Euphydryas editha]